MYSLKVNFTVQSYSIISLTQKKKNPSMASNRHDKVQAAHFCIQVLQRLTRSTLPASLSAVPLYTPHTSSRMKHLVFSEHILSFLCSLSFAHFCPTNCLSSLEVKPRGKNTAWSQLEQRSNPALLL